MWNKNTFTYIAKAIFCVLLITGCSTKKNTLVTRTYHNITAHYNIFFNGYESFKKGIQKLENQYRDDYTSVLPVFDYNDVNIAGNISSDMDRAINKATKVITFHSITAKPKIKKKYLSEKDKAFLQKTEYNKWIDDSYLLIGKSHFYKHDFSLAIETFNFLVKKFNTEPSKYEALIWLIRSYNQKEDFRESERLLTLLENDEKLPKKLKSAFYATYAEYYLLKGDFENSIPKLELALEHTKKKKHKLRYYYLLAQLYQESGDMNRAAEMYRKVIKMNPPYEMTFNARMNLASVYKSESRKGKSLKDELHKMLKDEKNKEYLDQVYYALGEIEITENNIEQALEYFKLSTQYNVSNNKQKAKSYLTIADIYYDRPEYRMAEAYYDSAVTLLEKDYPDYEIIYNKSKNLSYLVENLTTIEVQDSLLILAQLSEKKRVARIDAAIKRIIEEEQEAKMREQEQRMNTQYDRMTYQRDRYTDNVTDGSGWYFYNPNAITFGQKEFVLRWGKRKLEDNWRRSVKITVAMDEEKDLQTKEDADVKETQKLVTDKKKREYYLQYIPLTDSMMEEAHNKIIEAYYEVGIIYKNDLNDYELAIEAFKELNNRYPDNKYAISVYYELYKINTILGNITTSDFYKNIIIKNYPQSLYAKVLINPNYFKELEAEQKKVSDLYEETYHAYKNGLYSNVITNADKALELYPDHEYIPKFMFLKALAIGKSSDMIVLSNELKQLIADYPDSEIKPEAENLLAYLSKTDETVKEQEEQIILEEKQAEAEELYSLDESSNHYYAIVVDNNADINQLKFNIINFNLDIFSKNNFDVASDDLGAYQIVRIIQMKTMQEAFNYQSSISNIQDIFIDVNTTETYSFVISAENYNTLVKDKSVEKYLLFYNKYIQIQ